MSNSGNASNYNLPKSKDSSRSSSPSLHYLSNSSGFEIDENTTTNNNLNNSNSRFQKIPVLAVQNMDENISDLKIDQPKHGRFEVEKVSSAEENVALLASNTERENNNTFLTVVQTEVQDTLTSQYSQKSALKKHSKFNDDVTYQKEGIVPKKPEDNDECDDEDEDMDNECIRLNYNRNKQAKSVTINCGSPTLNSYMNCCNDIKSLAFYKKLLAEYIGTMFLVLYVCSIGLSVAEKKGVPAVNGALGGGLMVATIVWCLGSISGAHLNPAVTVSFLVTGKINPLATILYIGFQLLGAITGSYILNELVPDFAKANLSITSVHEKLDLFQAFGVEFIITFILVLTVFSCVDEERKDLNGSFPLSIGIAIIIGSLFGGPLTGGSMNPARSFGPAVVMNNWKDHWIYWIGPISGGVTAGILYKFILRNSCLKRKYRQSLEASP